MQRFLFVCAVISVVLFFSTQSLRHTVDKTTGLMSKRHVDIWASVELNTESRLEDLTWFKRIEDLSEKTRNACDEAFSDFTSFVHFNERETLMDDMMVDAAFNLAMSRCENN